jgi:hypothetical protein
MVLPGDVRALRIQNGPRDQGIERRSGLEIFYKLHNPKKVTEIDSILRTHTAEELVISLQALYDAVPAQWVDVKGAVLGKRGEARVEKMKPGYRKPKRIPKKKIPVFRKNERCMAQFKSTSTYWQAKVIKRNRDGTYSLKYSGDDSEWDDCPVNKMKKLKREDTWEARVCPAPELDEATTASAKKMEQLHEAMKKVRERGFTHQQGRKFWSTVAAELSWSIEDSQQVWFDHVQAQAETQAEAQALRKKAAKEKKNEEKGEEKGEEEGEEGEKASFVKLAGKQTMKRKQQLREIYEQAEEGHEDDVCGHVSAFALSPSCEFELELPSAARRGKDNSDCPDADDSSSESEEENEEAAAGGAGASGVDKEQLDGYILQFNNRRGRGQGYAHLNGKRARGSTPGNRKKQKRNIMAGEGGMRAVMTPRGSMKVTGALAAASDSDDEDSVPFAGEGRSVDEGQDDHEGEADIATTRKWFGMFA